jgi:hypothetical protein
MKLMNPFILIYNQWMAKPSHLDKAVSLLFGLWAATLLTLAVSGIAFLITDMIMNPSTIDNISWGLIDNLG